MKNWKYFTNNILESNDKGISKKTKKNCQVFVHMSK